MARASSADDVTKLYDIERRSTHGRQLLQPTVRLCALQREVGRSDAGEEMFTLPHEVSATPEWCGSGVAAAEALRRALLGC